MTNKLLPSAVQSVIVIATRMYFVLNFERGIYWRNLLENSQALCPASSVPSKPKQANNTHPVDVLPSAVLKLILSQVT